MITNASQKINMQSTTNLQPSTERSSWRELLATDEPLLLPSAHDALAALLIQQAGFKAYQIGGYSVVGARFGWPDIALAQFGEMSSSVREIIAASTLPVLVDCDDGYGDAKNVTNVVRTYESMGVSAIFLEDQSAPKRCGHMDGKNVVPAEVMEAKLAAALAARRTDLFVIARCDARAPLGLDEALRRGERYFKAGVDGLFIEAPHSIEELKRIASAFRGKHLVANMLEGGGKTPLVAPSELCSMGFSMVFYPTSLIFRVARVLQDALADILQGRYTAEEKGMSFKQYTDIVGLPEWVKIETEFSREQKPSVAA